MLDGFSDIPSTNRLLMVDKAMPLGKLNARIPMLRLIAICLACGSMCAVAQFGNGKNDRVRRKERAGRRKKNSKGCDSNISSRKD